LSKAGTATNSEDVLRSLPVLKRVGAPITACWKEEKRQVFKKTNLKTKAVITKAAMLILKVDLKFIS